MGNERDIRLTFDGVADIYERARPNYPGVFFDQLFQLLPLQPDVLEMGAGTGQATQPLLERGAVVTAVELGPALAARLRQKYGTNDALTVLNASFEDAPVEHQSFDAVVAATAYHWVEAAAKVERPLELLRPRGVLAVFDLIQVDSPTDQGYFAAVQPIYDRHGATESDRPHHTYESAMPSIVEPLQSSGRYSSVNVYRQPWDQNYTADQYRDLLLTYSGTQMKPEPERSMMVDALIQVVNNDFGGTITRPLCATMTVATAL